MIWAINAAQAGQLNVARQFLKFPDEVAGASIDSKFAIHPWACETMLNEVLTIPKKPIILGRPNRRLDCSTFSALAKVNNVLLNLENAEDEITLQNICVLKEIHRITQRQFEWQRGVMNMAHHYRSAFIYRGQKTLEYFNSYNGFSLDDFSFACFAISSYLRNIPFIASSIDISSLGISASAQRAILNHISLPHPDAKKLAAQIRSSKSHTGYRQSLFRRYPCIAFDDGDRLIPTCAD